MHSLGGRLPGLGRVLGLKRYPRLQHGLRSVGDLGAHKRSQCDAPNGMKRTHKNVVVLLDS